MAAEIDLPEPIIQHIQSFLFWKEAARTSLVSKSWYAAWSTRPHLPLNQRDFDGGGNPNGFSNFARTSLERYRRLNRKLDKFEVWISVINDEVSNSFVDEIIIDALDLEVNDLILGLDSSLVLPVEVFDAWSLTDVFISSCQIDDPVTNGPVYWPCVWSLYLSFVSLGDGALSAILEGCPLIERFHVMHSQGLTKIDVSKLHNLRYFTVSHEQSPLVVEFQDYSVVKSVQQFHQLSSMELFKVDISSAFFHQFAVKFPCLERLTIHYCSGHENVQISSHSLKRLSLKDGNYNSVQLDVPNICEFIYSCTNVPLLSVSTDLNECESDISFEAPPVLEASWFVELREFLKALKLSKISLKPHYFWGACVIPAEDIPGFSKPKVENLIVGEFFSSSTVFYAFLSGLLWSCHPKFLILNSANLEKQESLYKRLTEKVNQNYSISTENSFCVHGLEEVIVELYEDALVEWKPVFWEDLLGSWNGIQNARIRFCLKW